MTVKAHGGVITDQSLVGQLRFFQIAGTGVFANTVGTTGIVFYATPNASAGVGTGSGYVVGNDLTVVGGTHTTAAILDVLTVDGSGAVKSVRVDGNGGSNPGAYSVLPTNPVSVTGGAGTGATFVLDFASNVIIPNASLTERLHHVPFGGAVVGSAADRALAVVEQKATIVQIAIIDNDTIQFAVENTSFGWANAAAIQVAVRALGTITVPDNTSDGVSVDVSGVTVTEKFFSSGLA